MPTTVEPKTHQQNVDDIVNEVMDDISDVLEKYRVKIPDWDSDYVMYNLEDKIYALIFQKVKHSYKENYNLSEDDLENVVPFSFLPLTTKILCQTTK